MAGTHDGPAVALVGFMGSGKSAVGRELGAALGIPFLDTDDLVVAQAGPIDALFSERGEAAFRAIESVVVTAAVVDALARPCVLALGGGAVLSDEVREALARLSHVVWLTAPADVLWARTSAVDQTARPLAADELTFRALLVAREPLYREVATQVVDGSARSATAIAADLVAGWSRADEEAAEDGAR